MAALGTSNIVLPVEVANNVFKKAAQASAIAKLCPSEPQKFGTSKVMVLTGEPVAELVGEGGEKGSTPIGFAPKAVTPLKVQVTVRMTDEVKWADEDHQLDIYNTIEERCGVALGRALDLMALHKFNPNTATASALIPSNICATTNTATLANGKYDAAIEAAAAALVADGYFATGVAADPTFKFGLGTQKDADGKLLFPTIGMGLEDFAIYGLKGATSNTVSAIKETTANSKTATGVKAVVGQWDAFRWGVQREITGELIEHGDPDGLGDLKRLNQIAYRMEIVYGIGIMDEDAFAVIK